MVPDQEGLANRNHTNGASDRVLGVESLLRVFNMALVFPVAADPLDDLACDWIILRGLSFATEH